MSQTHESQVQRRTSAKNKQNPLLSEELTSSNSAKMRLYANRYRGPGPVIGSFF